MTNEEFETEFRGFMLHYMEIGVTSQSILNPILDMLAYFVLSCNKDREEALSLITNAIREKREELSLLENAENIAEGVDND